MTRSKKIDKKEVKEIKVVEDAVVEAKRKRREAWEAKKSVEIKEENSREEFRKFFVKVRAKLKITQDMEEVIWIHFRSAGFDKKEKFEKGLWHFGYRK